MSPYSRAFSASIMSPVSSISMAALRPMARLIGTLSTTPPSTKRSPSISTEGKMAGTAAEARIASTEEVLEKLRADYLATGGALQECDYWLAQLPAAPLREVREETA